MHVPYLIKIGRQYADVKVRPVPDLLHQLRDEGVLQVFDEAGSAAETPVDVFGFVLLQTGISKNNNIFSQVERGMDYVTSRNNVIINLFAGHG